MDQDMMVRDQDHQCLASGSLLVVDLVDDKSTDVYPLLVLLIVMLVVVLVVVLVVYPIPMWYDWEMIVVICDLHMRNTRVTKIDYTE